MQMKTLFHNNKKSEIKRIKNFKNVLEKFSRKTKYLRFTINLHTKTP